MFSSAYLNSSSYKPTNAQGLLSPHDIALLGVLLLQKVYDCCLLSFALLSSIGIATTPVFMVGYPI